jgi:uncharacterized protein (DUF488 family)
MRATIFTIGHSTRSLEEFLDLLRGSAVRRLADIRRFPGSRRHPHFSSEALAASLAEAGIGYIHLPELGGRRKASRDSNNMGWRNEAFRAYADYMAEPEFAQGIERLLDTNEVTAIMCAEAVPWRCHRNLVSDDLVRRGLTVLHITGAGAPSVHAMNPMARVVGKHLEYPGEQGRLV